ncbi:keratin, type I cytoskeletal 10-like [Gigantopelta aegis]|uniref:keratin, type I cytoskeletal 10-like n=1 Tax=Gigantopelta aegis TaxID=1735272 RepID=UPI001B88D694|nr:keratin, type I cytoskeletal 10-like [Gigantopelta aegis]
MFVKASLLGFAALLFVAQAAVPVSEYLEPTDDDVIKEDERADDSADVHLSHVTEDDLRSVLQDVQRYVKRAVAHEHILREIEHVKRHLEILHHHLDGDGEPEISELRELTERQLSIIQNSDGSKTYGLNIPLGAASVSGSFTKHKGRLTGGSLGGTLGAGLQGSGSLSYDRKNGFGGSAGLGVGASGYGTDAHVGWSQKGGWTKGVGVKAGPVGASLDHGKGGWSSSVGLSGGGHSSGGRKGGSRPSGGRSWWGKRDTRYVLRSPL